MTPSASLAVLVGGAVLVADPALHWVDPVASLAIALIIVIEAYRLLRASVDVLLESSPADVDLDELTAAMGTVRGRRPRCTTSTCGACRATSGPCPPTSC